MGKWVVKTTKVRMGTIAEMKLQDQKGNKAPRYYGWEEIHAEIVRTRERQGYDSEDKKCHQC